MRLNVYKKDILDLLEKNHLLSIAEIHKKLDSAHYATVYRNVDQLLKEGLLRKILITKDDIRYELATHDHDHISCEACGTISEIHISREILDISKDFKIKDLHIRGLCKNCY